jgi:hypothetical protein
VTRLQQVRRDMAAHPAQADKSDFHVVTLVVSPAESASAS